MLKLKEDGYVYVSDRGIEYELLEGMSIGANKRYTSDIIFIILNDAEYNVEEHIVGYLFGASVLERQLMDYDELITDEDIQDLYIYTCWNEDDNKMLVFISIREDWDLIYVGSKEGNYVGNEKVVSAMINAWINNN